MVESLVVASGEHITSTVWATDPYEDNMHGILFKVSIRTKRPSLDVVFRTARKIQGKPFCSDGKIPELKREHHTLWLRMSR